MPGHSIQRCYKINGYPQGFKNEKDKKVVAAVAQNDEGDSQGTDTITFTTNQYQKLLQLIAKDGSNEEITHDSYPHSKAAHAAGKYCFTSATGLHWIVDSGATYHMCCDLSLFKTYTDVQENDTYITIPDGSKVLIKYVGVVHLNNDLILRDVLYVPDFKFNLISIPKICKDLSCSVTFTDEECFLQSLSMRPLHLGSFKHGLYYLEESASNVVKSAVSSANTVSLDIN